MWKLFDDLKVNLPWPTWIAVHGRTALFAVVLSIPVVAHAVHRHERAQTVLGVIAAEYAFALWLFARDILQMAT